MDRFLQDLSKLKQLVLTLSTISFFFLGNDSSIASDLVVTLPSGQIAGQQNMNGYSFKGIPYAVPPVGALRWQPTNEMVRWSGVRDATQYGSDCLQKSGDALLGSEDCLYLNVWTPKLAPTRPLAVMVFIHGGSFVVGSGIQYGGVNLYIGDNLAKRQDVVVVTLNYRLGPMGFLAHPGMTSLNHGILDQVAALRWVKQNISAFGGNPDNVTVFGQSAGGISVCTLLASPLTKGLFHRAIIQSGFCSADDKMFAFEKGRQDAKNVGCARDSVDEEVKCLKQVPAEKLMETMRTYKITDDLRNLPYFTTIDGNVLKASPMATIAKKEHNKVPVMIGSNAEEVPGITYIKSDFQIGYDIAIWKRFPDLASFRAVTSYYSLERFGSYRAALGALQTDLSFTCPARAAADALDLAQSNAVYSYIYAANGAFHGVELPTVFQQLGILGGVIEIVVGRYWSNFAKVGVPDAGYLLPQWPVYSNSTKEVLYITAEAMTPQRNFHGDACDMLAKVGALFR